ncbi:MAG: hypothetical protein CMP81_15845 [Fulvimarina sp.]|nr:hypothetical protein [Fulvimarina sp.]
MSDPGKDVLRRAAQNKSRRFPDRNDPRYQGLLFPAVKPSFSIEPGSSVMTIGSCFARNVERALALQGVDVPATRFSAAQDNLPGQPNRVLNHYNPGTMLQAIRAVGDAADFRGIVKTPSGYTDLLLATGQHTVSLQRAKERRRQILAFYEDGLNRAQTVIITLGMVECWYDEVHQLWLNDVYIGHLRTGANRYSFHQLDADRCTEIVSQIIDALGDKNVLLTVSPVPMKATFTDVDCIIANMYSKSTLRVCAERICRQYSNVDYFPSYEIVSAFGHPAFGPDNIHVRQSVIARIVGNMIDHYVAPAINQPKTVPMEEASAQPHLAVRPSAHPSLGGRWRRFNLTKAVQWLKTRILRGRDRMI